MYKKKTRMNINDQYNEVCNLATTTSLSNAMQKWVHESIIVVINDVRRDFSLRRKYIFK